jgi:DNA integrity scanning protein DisA with diadenylate cyclase activity
MTFISTVLNDFIYLYVYCIFIIDCFDCFNNWNIHVTQSISYGLYIAACIWIKWILNKIELNWIEWLIHNITHYCWISLSVLFTEEWSSPFFYCASCKHRPICQLQCQWLTTWQRQTGTIAVMLLSTAHRSEASPQSHKTLINISVSYDNETSLATIPPNYRTDKEEH